jgi:hypothetical protein
MTTNIGKVLLLSAATLALAACNDDEASVASQNWMKDAANFKINRRIVFYNSITDDYILSIEGKCSLLVSDQKSGELNVICKTGPDQYKKHYLGPSNNIAYFAEQLEPQPEGAYRHVLTYKPSVIVPDVGIKSGTPDAGTPNIQHQKSDGGGQP